MTTTQFPDADNPAVVIEGDCRPVLAGLADAAVDAVITDPPYSAVTHDGARTGNTGDKVLIDFPPLADAEFVELCRQGVRVARRWVLMTCDWRHAALAEQAMPEAFVRCGVWVKPDAAPQFTGDRPGTGWEAVLILHRPGKKRWNGGGHHATWTCGLERNNVHPTQKPLALVRTWVRLFTDPGEVVLDPFGGSGTTPVAAVMEGRRAVMVEGNPAHAETARRRIAHALGLGSLFAPTVAAKSRPTLLTALEDV